MANSSSGDLIIGYVYKVRIIPQPPRGSVMLTIRRPAGERPLRLRATPPASSSHAQGYSARGLFTCLNQISNFYLSTNAIEFPHFRTSISQPTRLIFIISELFSSIFPHFFSRARIVTCARNSRARTANCAPSLWDPDHTWGGQDPRIHGQVALNDKCATGLCGQSCDSLRH